MVRKRKLSFAVTNLCISFLFSSLLFIFLLSADSKAQNGNIDPFIERLKTLENISTLGMRSSRWEHGGTAIEIRGRFPSGLDRTRLPKEHFRKFLEQNHDLWGLTELDTLQIDLIKQAEESDPCSFISVQKKSADGIPVLNANLRGSVDRDGNIRWIRGKMTGEVPQIDPQNVLSREQADLLLKQWLKNKNMELPEPKPVIFDPFYFGASAHHASKAWQYKLGDSKRGNVIIVIPSIQSNSSTGEVIVASEVVQEGEDVCDPGSESVNTPLIIVDKKTEVPRYVSFEEMGGLMTKGQTAIEQAYSVFENEKVAGMYGMYGTLAPKRNLIMPRVITLKNGSTRVKFQQAQNGIIVEGAYATVTLAPSGSALYIHSRLVFRPGVSSIIPELGSEVALQGALLQYLNLECGADTNCITNRQPRKAPEASLVILSSRLIQGAEMLPQTEQLAWKFMFPRRVIYWSAEKPGKFLFSYRTVFDCNFPWEVRNLAQGDRIEMSGNGGGQPLHLHLPMRLIKWRDIYRLLIAFSAHWARLGMMTTTGC